MQVDASNSSGVSLSDQMLCQLARQSQNPEAHTQSNTRLVHCHPLGLPEAEQALEIVNLVCLLLQCGHPIQQIPRVLKDLHHAQAAPAKG